MSASNNRIIWIDLLKIVSAFCVIILHTSSQKWYYTDVATTQWAIVNFYHSAVRFCVPIFIMASGVFFLDINKNVTIKKIFTVNIPKIVIAYLFWSTLYAIYKYTLYGENTPEGRHQVFDNILFGDYHLWFLFTLLGLYVIVPLLRRICERKKDMEYFLLLSLVFNFAFNVIELVPGLENFVNQMLYKSNINFVLGYTAYFVLGNYLYRVSLKMPIKIAIYILGILSTIYTIWVSTYISLESGTPVQSIYDNLTVNVFFMSAGIFLFFKDFWGNIKYSEVSIKIISLLSECSFGIYLVHEAFNMIIFWQLRFDLFIMPVAISIPLISIFIFLLSFSITLIIKKIPILRRIA